MSRYRILRKTLGCDVLTAAFIATLNWVRGVPPNRIVFMSIEIEVTP